MRIKIKNPDTAAHSQALWTTGILSLLILAGASAALYFVGNPATAWSALNGTINDICGEDIICRLGFAFMFKILPFLILGVFALCIWEKRTKFPSPLPGTYFTHVTFGPDGVLLEKPNPAKNVFFPYAETSFDMTATVHQVTIKGSPVTAVFKVEFIFAQTGGKTIKVKLLPPRGVIPFLCKILDKRNLFARFSYDAVPLSSFYHEAAQTVRQKLEKYCQTGFISTFNSNGDRLTFAAVGIVFLWGIITTYRTFGLENFFRGGFFMLIPLCAWFLYRPLKDIYLERKSRRR